MSMPLVALCADEECFRHPELLGLDGENLLAQQWLMPFTSAASRPARRCVMRQACRRCGWSPARMWRPSTLRRR